MRRSFKSQAMPTNKENLTVYLPTEIKQKLLEWAQQEQRSMSFLAERIITEAVLDWEKSQQEQP